MDNDQDITLRDVIHHIGATKQELLVEIRRLDTTLTGRIDRLNEKVDFLSKDVQANHEDLKATMLDVLKIRKHVGMV